MPLTRNQQSWIAASLFILLAALTLFDPLPEPTQSILQALIFFPTAIWAWAISRRCSDEVMIHASRKAFAHGVPIGAAGVITAVLAMRYWKPATDLVVTTAQQSNSGLPPSAVGFGYGAMFAIATIALTAIAIYAAWWMRSR